MLSKTTGSISSKLLAANLQFSIQCLPYSSFGSQCYFYRLRRLSSRVRHIKHAMLTVHTSDHVSDNTHPGIALHSFLSTRPLRSRSISPPLNFRNISRPYTTSPPMKTRNLQLPARLSNIPQSSPPSPPYPPCLFVRLLTLVGLLSVVIIGLTITDIVYVAMRGKMRSYPSFNSVHHEISRIDVFFLSRRDNVDGTAQTPVHFVQLLTWTAPAPAAAYIFILTVMHWCECVRFVARIGGTGRWVRWKVARVRGWFRGEKVWEEESVHDEPIK